MIETLFSHGYAVFIGVGADLPATVCDVEALSELFTNPGIAAYPPDQVKLLKERGATRENILATVQDFASQVNKDLDATMILYFSGHGGRFKSPTRTTEYFLLPYGYDEERRAETAISGQELTDLIELYHARRLVVFLDCCHAGGMSQSKGAQETFEQAPLPPALLRVLQTGSGHAIVASSLENEKSYYNDPNSIFTECLLEALSGKAKGKNDGFARILDVLSYLIDQVPMRAMMHGSQHPFISRMLDVSDNFALCYSGGGSKALPGGASLTMPPPRLTQTKRRRLEQDQIARQGERQILVETLRRLREAWIIEPNVMNRIPLEHRIKEEEIKLAELDKALDGIEAQLSSQQAEISLILNRQAPSAKGAFHSQEAAYSPDTLALPPSVDALPNEELPPFNEMTELLTEDERQRLIHLLDSLPDMNYANVRHSLVSGLPERFQKEVDFDKQSTLYFYEMIDKVTQEATFQLPDGTYPILLVIQNAMKRAKEVPFEQEFQYLLARIKSRLGASHKIDHTLTHLDRFIKELNNFIFQMPAVRYELQRISSAFDDFMYLPECEDMCEHLANVNTLISDFSSAIMFFPEPKIISNRIWLMKALGDYDKAAREVQNAIDLFCKKYGGVWVQAQAIEESKKIQQKLAQLRDNSYKKALEEAKKLLSKLTDS